MKIREVRATRETVGPESLLMVDAGGSDAFWKKGYKWALRTAGILADYDVLWFEEPLQPDALDDYVELRKQAPVPIAGGEVLIRRQAFQPYAGHTRQTRVGIKLRYGDRLEIHGRRENFPRVNV